MAGCGTPGAPEPPSLNLPEAVADLSGTRTGDTVTLTWTMPKRNTDKLVMKGDIAVRVCRKTDTDACNDASGPRQFAPGADATWSETLPHSLDSGVPRTFSYFVELKNKSGRSAGLSNAAVVLAGAPPASVASFTAEASKASVLLRWSADGTSGPIRLDRKLLTPPMTKPQESLAAPPAEPVEQNLLIEDTKQGRAVDKSVRMGETYEYRAQRLARAAVDGKTLELEGQFSAPVRVEVRDVFPPDVPTGLAAVAALGANGGETAIDLSWQPVADANIAGYVVYRREGGGVWERVSPTEPVVGPAFHDTRVLPGRTYRYAVSAVSQSGHESGRSDEAQETVPNR
jgi:hypothetical protein